MTDKTDNYLRRLNYTNGQLLEVSDFTDEQKYHLKARRRHNQLVHSWGIVAGLEVAAVDGDTDLVIKPGMAIDNEGREIVLIGPETEPVKLKGKTDLRGTTFFLTLALKKDDDEEKDTPHTDKDVVMYYRRTVERPLIGFPTTAPATDGSVITLAKVTVAADGKVTFDASARSRSVSSRIDPAADLTVRHLVVGGNVGVGTTSPENAEGWYRVLDVVHSFNAKLSVRASGIDARVMAHGGIYGAPAGMLVGAKSNHALSLVTNAATRMTIDSAGNVGIGTGSVRFELGAGKKLSLGDKGSFEIDKPGVVGGRFIVTDGGNVGIGKASPAAKLEVAIADNDTSTNPLAIGKGALPYLMMLNNGNVGIGTEPDAKLLVSGLLTATRDNEALVGLRILPIFQDSGWSGVKHYGLIVGNGNVGIGTQSPGAKLEVAIADNDASTNPLAIGKGGLPYLMVVNNGNVGIGSEPDAKLLVSGLLTATRDNEELVGLRINPNFRDSGRSGVKHYGLIVGQGNVGIGATSPGAKLEVGGKLTATADNDALIGVKIAPTFDDGGKKEVKHYGLIVTDGNVGIGTTAPGAKLEVAGTLTATADNDTLVGLKIAPTFDNANKTGVKCYRLDVSGQADTVGHVSLQLRSGNRAYNSESNQITLGFDNRAHYRHAIKTRHHSAARYGNAIDFYVWKYLSASDKDDADTIGTLHTMTLDGGNVGIGTTSPGAKLEVGGKLTATADNDALIGVKIAPTFDDVGQKEVKRYGLIVTDGNVGIGTTSPGAKLDVVGDINASYFKARQGATISGFDDGELSTSSSTVPTSKAVKAYIDGQIAKLQRLFDEHVHDYRFSIFQDVLNPQVWGTGKTAKPHPDG